MPLRSLCRSAAGWQPCPLRRRNPAILLIYWMVTEAYSALLAAGISTIAVAPGSNCDDEHLRPNKQPLWCKAIGKLLYQAPTIRISTKSTGCKPKRHMREAFLERRKASSGAPGVSMIPSTSMWYLHGLSSQLTTPRLSIRNLASLSDTNNTCARV